MKGSNMLSIVYLDGNFCKASEAKVSVFDRGLLFADSIYEVIPVYKGRPFYLDRHLKRLKNNLNNTKIPEPPLNWHSIINELIQQNGGGDLQVYLQITRGNQGVRKHDIPSDPQPTVIAFTIHTAYPAFEEKQQGLHAKLVEDIRWLRCDIKTTSLMANILMNDDAVSNGADTAILSREGFLTEGGSSNVFLVDKHGGICTPPLNNFCLPGITRQIAIELINSFSWPFREENSPIQTLFDAQEIWITSTTKEIYPVTRLNDSIISNGSGGQYWKQLNEKYQQLIINSHD